MKYLTIKPILGLKNNCAPDSIDMYKALDERGQAIATHAAGGQNVEFTRERMSTNKAYGYAMWNKDLIPTPSLCMGLKEIFNGTLRDLIIFDHGKVYYYDVDKDPAEILADPVVLFATGATDIYSLIAFGGYIIWADRAEHTPYKWTNGDANSSKLITTGTEYLFRYLTHIANRIIGAYTTEATAPDLSIRWTDALTGLGTVDFKAANQIYKPEGDESITGVGRLGNDLGYIFSEKDITRLEYYPSHSPVFEAICAIRGVGTNAPHSIASDGQNLYFFDPQRGFVEYNGASNYNVISTAIEETIAGIDITYANLIIGKSIPSATGNKLIWTIPAAGSATPDKLITYDPTTKQWTPLGTEVVRAMDHWQLPSSTERSFVFANTDGKLYERTGETANALALAGDRIEPVLPLQPPEAQKRLLEIWFSINNRHAVGTGTYIHVWHRGGDTVGELENTAWGTAIGTIDMEDPAKPVIYTDKTFRLHQLKWGTDAKDEYFSVGEIRVGYTQQGHN